MYPNQICRIQFRNWKNPRQRLHRLRRSWLRRRAAWHQSWENDDCTSSTHKSAPCV